MIPKIPLPTDNIYKFYAFFGLVLLISSFAGLITSTNSTNAKILDYAASAVQYEADGNITNFEEQQIELLKRLIDIAKSDQNFYLWISALLATVGILLIYFGFSKWHRHIQPRDDSLVELEIMKLKKDLGLDIHKEPDS